MFVGRVRTDSPSLNHNEMHPLLLDQNGNCLVSLGTTLAGEDPTNDVLKVEERFAYYPVFVASTAVKSAPGFLHCITFSCADGTPTAGTIAVYDNTSATGNKLFEWSVAATAFIPFTVFFDVPFSIGLYVAVTTTNDVNISVSYR